MSNVFGKQVTLILFGESHGPCVGATLDGLPSGIAVNEEEIKEALKARRPAFQGETPRVEADDFEILSGVFEGKTTGEPLTIIIKNNNTHSTDYDEVATKCRPNHADFVSHVKYGGHEDYRGGGHFSGRITAAIVACGAIAMRCLHEKGIDIGAHVLTLGDVKDDAFSPTEPEIQIKELENKMFPILDSAKEEAMKKEMESASISGDSIGGSVEVALVGLPVGLGEPWFNRFDGALANAMMSIGGVRGVVFGDIDERLSWRGSEFNDAFYVDEQNKAKTKTNHSGGVQGGLTNGMPVVFKVWVKPTPSISREQKTISKDGQNTTLALRGRHDPCIVRRITPVLKAMAALVALDFVVQEFGRR